MARYTYIKKEPQWDGFSLLGRGGLSPFLTLDGPVCSALIEGVIPIRVFATLPKPMRLIKSYEGFR